MTSTSEPTIYRALDRRRKEIRIATIIPSTDRAAPIVVDLHVVSLDESPEYIALSYCWSSLSGTGNIILCGQDVAISTNLWEALRQFRSEQLTLWWWIDALCINQNDTSERNSQVMLMRELYYRASSVRVWLGPSTQQTEAGFEFLRFVMTAPELDVSSDHIDGEYATVAGFRALGDIFRSPYWSRRWITQEIFLSRVTFLHRGGFQIGPLFARDEHGFPTISKYIDACTDIACRNLGGRDSFSNVVLYETDAIRAALMPFLDPKRTRNASSLEGFFRTVASDPHDYVYGLLGILPEDIGIVPDYRLDFRAVFTDFAFRFLKSYQVMHFLYLAGSNTDGLPSWVPDLRHRYDSTNAASFPWDSSPLGPTNKTFKVPMLCNFDHVYDASLGTPFGIRDRVEDTLVVSGIIVDKIIAIGDRLSEGEDGFGDLNETFKVFAGWQQLYQRLFEERKFVNQSCYDKSSFEIAMDFVFTVCADVSRDFDDPSRPFRRCRRDEFEEYMLGIFWSLEDYPEGVDTQRMQARFQWLDILAARNTFFVTENGRMGYAIRQATVGDQICILSGMAMPMHVRQVGDRPATYNYQGVAYVQGIMYGEAMLEAAAGDRDRINAVFEEIRLE